MSPSHAASLAGQAPGAQAPRLSGHKPDHLWWLNDACRIVREAAWAQLEPAHVRHLIEEVQDLQQLLDRAIASGPPEPLG